jgi:hypothetical protein
LIAEGSLQYLFLIRGSVKGSGSLYFLQAPNANPKNNIRANLMPTNVNQSNFNSVNCPKILLLPATKLCTFTLQKTDH